MSKSISIIYPMFNRDMRMVEYTIGQALEQGVDEIVIANTGEKRVNYAHPQVREVHQPMPYFYPGITRNMGAVIANGDVQIHSGLDIIPSKGDWNVFRSVQDGEMVCGRICLLLRNQAQTEQAYAGARSFHNPFIHRPNKGGLQAITKRDALFRFKGPFDWEMRGWGRVDTDLYERARRSRMTVRWAEITIIHLWHPGGCNNMAFGSGATKHPDYQHNARLLTAKIKGRGWWSGIIEPTEAQI